MHGKEREKKFEEKKESLLNEEEKDELPPDERPLEGHPGPGLLPDVVVVDGEGLAGAALHGEGRVVGGRSPHQERLEEGRRRR